MEQTMRPFHTPYRWLHPFSPTAASCLLVGGLLLLAGRRLFWIFVAAAGFLLGAEVAARMASGRAEWVILAVALAFGLAGLVLSLFAQRLAIAAAGFVMGSYAVDRLILGLQGDGRDGGRRPCWQAGSWVLRSFSFSSTGHSLFSLRWSVRH
jgi:hypothetical protein